MDRQTERKYRSVIVRDIPKFRIDKRYAKYIGKQLEVFYLKYIGWIYEKEVIVFDDSELSFIEE